MTPGLIRKWVVSGLGRKRLVIALTGIVLSIGLPFALLFQSTGVQFLDNKLFDVLLLASEAPPPSPVPVIVDLDEQSISGYGQWPWPRYRVAMLLEKVRRLGASVVATDIVFSEPDRSSPKRIQDELLQELGVTVEFSGLPQALMDNDQVLANILLNNPFVLAFHTLFTPSDKDGIFSDHFLKEITLRTPQAVDDAEYLFTARGMLLNLAVLEQAVTSTGFFNTLPDPDGIIRRTPLIMSAGNHVYPSLGLAAVMRGTGIAQVIQKRHYGGIDLKVGNRIIPLDRKGNLLLRYKGPARTFRYVSAREIMDNSLPRGSFENRIVFVGTSAAGLRDLRSTPFDRNCPGVEIQATVADNILNGHLLSRPFWAKHVEVASAIIAGCLATAILVFAPPYLGAACLAVMMSGAWLLSSWYFSAKGCFISPLMPLTIMAADFSVLSLLKFWREESEKKYFHQTFSRYVAPSVVAQLVKSRDTISLSGEEKEVSILFSDIRGFTTLNETMTSQRVIELLRAYFTPMTAVIIEHQGTLDKFIGDAIMAFWNAPIDTPGHQVKAVRSALAMIRELERLNVGFEEHFGFSLNIGIGLHSGLVSVGNMGSEDLFDYTIIGDSVNLASRVEGLTKVYGLKLLVTDAIRIACQDSGHTGDLVFLEIDRVRVKGRDRPETLYTVVPRQEFLTREKEFQAYLEALGFYKTQVFGTAMEQFRCMAETHPGNILYQLYRDRCRDLILQPPESGWDGTFSHKTK